MFPEFFPRKIFLDSPVILRIFVWQYYKKWISNILVVGFCFVLFCFFTVLSESTLHRDTAQNGITIFNVLSSTQNILGKVTDEPTCTNIPWHSSYLYPSRGQQMSGNGSCSFSSIIQYRGVPYICIFWASPELLH